MGCFGLAPPRADVAQIGWVELELVGEVEFRTFTSAGRVWHTGGVACARAGQCGNDQRNTRVR